MNHAKAPFSKEMFAGAIICVVQYIEPGIFGGSNTSGTTVEKDIVLSRYITCTCLPHVALHNVTTS
jgi:hypothetical protein